MSQDSNPHHAAIAHLADIGSKLDELVLASDARYLLPSLLQRASEIAAGLRCHGIITEQEIAEMYQQSETDARTAETKAQLVTMSPDFTSSSKH